jgi:hypothetical protein
MTKREFLEWLAKEDESSLGECDSPLLQQLEAEGLIVVRPVNGLHAAYSRVSLTEAGWAALKEERK